MILLDLDSPSTWSPHLSSIVYNDTTWAKIECEISTPEKKSSFIFEFQKNHEEQSLSFVIELSQKADEILLEKYTHVIGYHGCRPRHLSSYKKSGLLPSNIKKLEKEAKALFDGIPGFNEALKDIGTDYQEHNDGKIGFLISRKWALSVNNSYSEGSEFVRSLANRLGQKAINRFSQTGKRTWIKVAIPMDWLDRYTTFPIRKSYASSAILGLIYAKKWPQIKSECFFDGGFLLTKAIPPENILKFYGHRKACEPQ